MLAGSVNNASISLRTVVRVPRCPEHECFKEITLSLMTSSGSSRVDARVARPTEPLAAILA